MRPPDELRRLRILFLIDQLVTRGGTERHLLDLSSGLARRGHDVVVMSLLDGAFAQAFQCIPQVLYRCLEMKRVFAAEGLQTILRIAHFIRQHRIDVIQSFHTGADLIAPIAAAMSLSQPIVISSRRDLGFTKLARHIRLQRILNLGVDAIAANSQAVKDAVVHSEWVPPWKVSVIYNGIESGQFSAPLVRNYNIAYTESSSSATQFIVGTLANLRPIKGIQDLVACARSTSQRRTDIHFLVAGDGEYRTQLENLAASNGLEQYVQFVGQVQDVPRFIAGLDLYVQPSHSEGFSNAVLEAMAGAKCVIATNVGGNSEVIQDGINGILIPPHESELMARKIELMIESPLERIRIGAAARKTVCTKYTLRVMLDAYESFYWNLCLKARKIKR